MTERKLEIDVNGVGLGTVRLDGQDVSSYVQGVSLSARVGDLTTVEIFVPAVSVKLGMPAEVRTVLGIDAVGALAEAVRDYLAARPLGTAVSLEVALAAYERAIA